MTMPTHYERLGVEADADRETIWRAYLTAVRTALSGDDPQTNLRELEEAWGMLRDHDSRAAYDHSLAAGGADAPAGDALGGDDPAEDNDAADEEPDDGADPGDAEPADDADAGVAPDAWAAGPGRRRRRRIAVAAAWLVAFALVGVAAGLGVQWVTGGDEALAEGSCVTLTATEAFPVACDAADADGRVAAVVDEPEACAETDGGWVERDDGRLACVELLTDG